MKKKKAYLGKYVILTAVFILTAFGFLATFIGYVQYTRSFTTQYQENAFSIAQSAEKIIIASDSMEEILNQQTETPSVQKLKKNLSILCDTMAAEFIYLIDVDQNHYDKMTFLLEVVNQDSHFSEYPAGYVRDTTNEEYRTKYQELYEGKTDYAIVTRDKGFIETGAHITVLLPIKNADNKTIALLGLQKQMVYLNQARIHFLLTILILSVLLIIIASLILITFLKKYLLTPIELINKETNRFATENTLSETPLSLSYDFPGELNQLAAGIDNMEQKTVDYFQSLSALTEEKMRVDTELELATKIQRGMLPDHFPAFSKDNLFDLYALMKPAKKVGGDFYDYFLINDHLLAFVIGDVSGKGIPAAIYMSLVKTIIKTHVMMHLSAAEVFTKVNNILCENNRTNLFSTTWMGFLDLKNGNLTYVNAGHNPPFIRQNNKEYILLEGKKKFVLGGFENIQYVENQITMVPGDRLFLYTDGITEASDTDNQMFGEERLAQCLDTTNDLPMTDVLKTVQQDIADFVKDAEQFDDMTMLGLSFLHYYSHSDLDS